MVQPILSKSEINILQNIEDEIQKLELIWDEEYKDVLWLKKYAFKKIPWTIDMYKVIIKEKSTYEKKWARLIKLHHLELIKLGKINDAIKLTESEVKKFKRNLNRFLKFESFWEHLWVSRLESPTGSWSTKKTELVVEINNRIANASNYDTQIKKGTEDIVSQLENMYTHRRNLIERIIKKCDLLLKELRKLE